MAPGAKIVLVEAASNSFNDLLAAVDKASQIYGVQEVSMSWGGSEFSSEVNYDSHFPQNGIIYFAASGDTGGKTIWPGTSPLVVSSGGTSINRTPATPSGTFTGETGWSGSGGGPSSYEPRPSYQSTAGHASVTKRLAPDFSFDADPNTGVSVYDSTKYQGVSGWLVFGGTSVAAPALAGIVNLAHDGATVSGTLSELQSIYDNMAGGYFRDILTGKAGSYNCESGWDYVTGVGSNLGPGGK
jgi:kumamolisin